MYQQNKLLFYQIENIKYSIKSFVCDVANRHRWVHEVALRAFNDQRRDPYCCTFSYLFNKMVNELTKLRFEAAHRRRQFNAL
ncbi:hypothetical protein T11_3424 [Trichinella zimbabwensis]|uniref:Uncharacterized protein n=1 Tax=Trichinella zimbabwensis TaxID=268475 RepID=A0A0V1I3I4_9BILA|nr:hypothetical protein T11_3424 [Trichinella zimbabwensis]